MKKLIFILLFLLPVSIMQAGGHSSQEEEVVRRLEGFRHQHERSEQDQEGNHKHTHTNHLFTNARFIIAPPHGDSLEQFKTSFVSHLAAGLATVTIKFGLDLIGSCLTPGKPLSKKALVAQNKMAARVVQSKNEKAMYDIISEQLEEAIEQETDPEERELLEQKLYELNKNFQRLLKMYTAELNEYYKREQRKRAAHIYTMPVSTAA